MKWENILKGIFTTLIGAAAMAYSLYGWSKDELTNWQAGGLAMIGFSLLWIRDDIAGFIKRFADAALTKFKK